MDVNMFTKIKNSDEKGQALVETILLIPFLFFVLLWLTQFYIATQTSEVVQEKTRNRLVAAIDNWRDLRDVEQLQPNIYPLAIDNIANQSSYSKRLIYKNKKKVEREVGSRSNGEKKLEVETKLGICRTVSCN